MGEFAFVPVKLKVNCFFIHLTCVYFGEKFNIALFLALSPKSDTLNWSSICEELNMGLYEITAQVIGVILIVITIISPHPKTRSGILFSILVANILSCLQFYFLDAKTGLFALIVTTVRSVVYWAYSSKQKIAPLSILTIFIVAQIAATVTGWVDWASLLTLCLLFNTYGQWQTKENVLRYCMMISAILLGVYCVYAHAYTGAINKFLQAISAMLAIYKANKL